MEALSLKVRDSELNLTGFNLEVTKVEEAKTSALKQLGDFEWKLKAANDNIRALTADLKEALEENGQLTRELEELKAGQAASSMEVVA